MALPPPPLLPSLAALLLGDNRFPLLLPILHLPTGTWIVIDLGCWRGGIAQPLPTVGCGPLSPPLAPTRALPAFTLRQVILSFHFRSARRCERVLFSLAHPSELGLQKRN